MPRAYGRLFILQDGNSEGFFTASKSTLPVNHAQARFECVVIDQQLWTSAAIRS
jgi:hypothetical protein